MVRQTLKLRIALGGATLDSEGRHQWTVRHCALLVPSRPSAIRNMILLARDSYQRLNRAQRITSNGTIFTFVYAIRKHICYPSQTSRHSVARDELAQCLSLFSQYKYVARRLMGSQTATGLRLTICHFARLMFCKLRIFALSTNDGSRKRAIQVQSHAWPPWHTSCL